MKEGRLPDGWQWRRLGEVAKINPRFDRHSHSYTDEVTFVPMASVEQETGKIDVTATKPMGDVVEGYTPFKEGDLLFAKITPCMENGKIAVAKGLKNGIGFASTEFHVLRFPNLITSEMYSYFLLQPKLRKQAAARMTGSAGQRRVPAGFLETLLVPCPPLKTQERIVRILERGRSTVQFAVQSRACSQQLPQSIFLQMFGDPVKNPKGWERHTISQIVTKERGAIKIGPFGSQLKKSELTEEGYKVYGQDNVISEDFAVGDRRISAGKFESMRVYELLPGDVVITMMGTIGKTAIVPGNIEEGIMDSHLIRIKLDKRVIDPGYFIWVFRHVGIQQQVLKGSHGAIMSGLNSAIVRNLAIPVPPLSLQHRFAKLVRGTSRIRELQCQSETSIKGLFDAVVADAFKGDLVV